MEQSLPRSQGCAEHAMSSKDLAIPFNAFKAFSAACKLHVGHGSVPFGGLPGPSTVVGAWHKLRECLFNMYTTIACI